MEKPRIADELLVAVVMLAIIVASDKVKNPALPIFDLIVVRSVLPHQMFVRVMPVTSNNPKR